MSLSRSRAALVSRNLTLLALGFMLFSWMMFYLEAKGILPVPVSIGTGVSLRIALACSAVAVGCGLVFVGFRLPRVARHGHEEIEELERLLHYYESEMRVTGSSKRRRLKCLQMICRLNDEIRELRRKRPSRDSDPPQPLLN